jgi:dienelactone hydrolase
VNTNGTQDAPAGTYRGTYVKKGTAFSNSAARYNASAMIRTILWAGLLAGAGHTQVLPDTAPLTWDGDLSVKMMDGAHRLVERKIAASLDARQQHWKRDFSSAEAYAASVQPNRARFLQKIGVVDARVPVVMERFGDERNPALAANGPGYRVYQVRWPVLDGVFGEGLLLEPDRPPVARVVALPDADQTPEQIIGLARGLAPEQQFARALAENGCQVLVPTMIDRTTRWSGHPEIQMTDQTHREWIYRQAFHMGRHVIGYEVQKALAAVDWMRKSGGAKIGIAGYGEGGLVAFYAAAADPGIDAALVAGYFNDRQEVWAEPIYRNVWGLLEEFGDAELSTLIAPRPLVVAYGRYPEVTGQKGDLNTPEFGRVQREFGRIEKLLKPGFQQRELVRGETGSAAVLQPFLRMLGAVGPMAAPREAPADLRAQFDPGTRQERQVRQLEAHVQRLVEGSETVRSGWFLNKVMPEFADRTWNTKLRFPTVAPEHFIQAAKAYRESFWTEAMGKFDDPLLPPRPRTRQIYSTPKWKGYEVVLDVWPDVFAWGILLVPNDLKPGERRPVVVCQHGRRGVPKDAVESDVYGKFAARLADQGFITFAPHNLYRGEDRYRWLSRKANGIKGTLFSFIIGQHDQILRWLGSLPFVDAKRIAFYGLSYGGETAVRVPTILEGYALSICSGDFNAWTQKVASTGEDFSFMYSIEW